MTGPGVSVRTATRSGPSGPTRAPSGQFFLAGLSTRGDVNGAILLRGMADVDALLGPRPTFGAAYDQLKTYFDEGGRQAVFARVVGTDPTTGTLNLMDRAGSPLSTLRVDAADPGAWSANLSVEVRNGSVANTFRIIVRLSGSIVHDYNNIASPAQAVSRFAGSRYVKVVSLGSVTNAPNNNPAVIGATTLTAGDDKRSTIVAANYVSALARFAPGLGDGSVAIPGQTGSEVWAGLIDHAVNHNRLALLAGALGDDKQTYLTNAASISPNNAEFAGFFGPFIVVSDGNLGTRTISPEGFVAACRARAHEVSGPWRAPAGAMGKANVVLGIETEWSQADCQELDAGRVSVVRYVSNSIRLYGWRSLSSDESNYAYLKDRDVLNRLVVEAENRMEAYVFAPIDARGQLLSSVQAELIGMVEPMRAAGGLFENIDEETGDVIDPGYRVDTGTSVNTREVLSSNEVRALLAVRVSPTGALIDLVITKVGITSGI